MDFDVWAVPRADEVPRLALARIVEALDNYVDTIELRDLPATYQRLVAAAPVSNLSRALGLDTETDSTETLQRLNEILAALDARLVLIVEDAERTGAAFETRHLERLLWALREIPNISFVLAFDPNHGPRIAFAKLCDTVELLPPMDDRDVAMVLLAAVDHWTSAHLDIDPKPERRGKLQLSYLTGGALLEFAYRTNQNRPLRHMTRLLKTPRDLKRFVARVDSAWKQLHGEVDLEDLLIITALREAATPVYEFLVSHIDAARCEEGSDLFGPASVKSEWTACLESSNTSDSIKHLVSLLGITQLSDQQAPLLSDKSPQGVHLSDPTDYFRRINAEELDPNDLRDQVVLGHIEEWRQGESNSLVAELVASRGDDPRYARIWKHFAFRHDRLELSRLATDVVLLLLETDGPNATMNHPAMVLLRHECERQLLNEENKDWLQNVILKSVPVNLSYAVDLYHRFTHPSDTIVTPEQREKLRVALVKAVHDTVRTDADLARHLNDQDALVIWLLITNTSPDEGPPALEAWGKHLAPILVKGARIHSGEFLAELANLVGTPASNMRNPDQYPPIFRHPYEIDRDRARTFLGVHLDNALTELANYKGNNPYAQRATEEAARWLQERGGKARA